MTQTRSYLADTAFFSASLTKEVLSIQFKDNLLSHLTDLSKRDDLLEFLQMAQANKLVRVILIHSDFSRAGCEEYKQLFLKRHRIQEHFDLHRLCNLTRQLILMIRNLDPLVIHVSQGSVISTFLHISMACDYRLASENTIFCNPYLDLGLIPIGAGPYFFSRIMGRGQVMETMLLNREIPVNKAKELGLVDRVLALPDIEEQAMSISRDFARLPMATIAGMKHLLNAADQRLETYMETEKQELMRILNSESFIGQLEN